MPTPSAMASLESGAVPWHPVRQSPLPLFRRDLGDGSDAYAAFYAPGRLCVVPSTQAEGFESAVVDGTARGGWTERLHAAAARAAGHARRLGEMPFRPECLTLYLNHTCNLRCTYCYADSAAPHPAPLAGLAPARLDLASIASAAHLVAANCRALGLPFYAGLHGGGEPLLDPALARSVLDLLDAVAQEHGVQPFYYVATNGVMPEATARWLAGRAHLVGLSCDGPPAIHDRQRPARDGHATLEAVQRTARVLRAAGTRLRVRATITRHSLASLPEVVDDICRRLGPEEVHVEPVYGGGRSAADDRLAARDAPAFVAGYLAACEVAHAHGVPLTTSGSRLETTHGPYCHLFRQVLNVVPGGFATACFKTATAAAARDRGVLIAAHDPATGRFALDAARLTDLRPRLATQPARCAACLNRCHCAGDCPDTCRLDVVAGKEAEPGFRCTMLRTLTAARLEARAAALWADVAAGTAMAPHGTDCP